MKIKTKVLADFLKKVVMKDEQIVKDARVNFTPDGVIVSANTTPQQVRVEAKLNVDAFVEYKALGLIGMTKLDLFCQLLKKFDDEIDISKKGNLLVISSGDKTLEKELSDVRFIEDHDKSPTIPELSDTWYTDADKIKGIFSDIDKIKDTRLIFATEVGKIIVVNTGEHKFTNVIHDSGTKGNVKVSFGKPLMDVVAGLTGNISIALGTDLPMVIDELEEFTTIKYIIAPYVEEK